MLWSQTWTQIPDLPLNHVADLAQVLLKEPGGRIKVIISSLGETRHTGEDEKERNERSMM